MSKLLRYQNSDERLETIKVKHQELEDGIGDAFFAFCRLANQLEVDIETAFNQVKDKIQQRYNSDHPESVKK